MGNEPARTSLTGVVRDPSTPFVTVSEFAIRFGVSKMTIYRLIEAEKIQATRVGRAFRIPRSEMAEYEKRNATGLVIPQQ